VNIEQKKINKKNYVLMVALLRSNGLVFSSGQNYLFCIIQEIILNIIFGK
jgi:hypothetical protein